MEEVDRIIIDSLRHLHCDIDENITSLKQFHPDMIANSISSCLEAIIPNSTFPHKLPPSMSLRLKVATNLTEQIYNLGFRGDMGYQSILYCNEIEIRRVLMYLIERLPRETIKTSADEIGYVPRLVKDIETRLKLAIQKPWVPSAALFQGGRDCGELFLQQSFGDSCTLQTNCLQIPSVQMNASEELRQYWVRNLSDVTKQCAPSRLIQSLLFDDVRFDQNHLFDNVEKLSNQTHAYEVSLDTEEQAVVNSPLINLKTQNNSVKEVQLSEMGNLIKEIQESKSGLVTLRDSLLQSERKLQEIRSLQTELDESLKETEQKVKVKSKTFAILSKEENVEKLKNLIENGKERLVDLAAQWTEVHSPLLEQYRNLKNNLSIEELKIQQENAKLDSLKETNRHLQEDLKDKVSLEQNLIEKCGKLPKNSTRSAHTNRILEIIGNIKKQNEEIQKVLQDTKEVQKEINTLNGQVDRSFTLSDELIFRDAKKDETARKAYKLLAALHSRYEEILKDVTDLGLIERESRNLQEQVEAENAKETSAKLERVLADIEQIKKESILLMNSN